VGPGLGAAVKTLLFYPRMLFSSRRESRGDQMTERNSSPQSTVSEEVAWGQVSDLHRLVVASNASQSGPKHDDAQLLSPFAFTAPWRKPHENAVGNQEPLLQ
jgi:hypothetical protein